MTAPQPVYTADTAPDSRARGGLPPTYPIGASGHDRLVTGELGPPLVRARFPHEELRPLLADYALFSHALLFQHGLPVDPVAVWYSQNNLPDRQRPVAVPLSQPCLDGLPFPHDHLLFAVPREHAPGLFREIGRTTAYSSRTGYYWDAVLQVMEEPFPVNLFAVAGRQAVWHWLPCPEEGTFRLVRSRALPETLLSAAYAQKVTNTKPVREKGTR